MIIKIYLNNILKFKIYFIFFLTYYLMTYLNRFILMIIYELLPYYQKLPKIKSNIKFSCPCHFQPYVMSSILICHVIFFGGNDCRDDMCEITSQITRCFRAPCAEIKVFKFKIF